MTDNTNGWRSAVHDDHLMRGVRILLGQRTQHGISYVTRITSDGTGFDTDSTHHVGDNEAAPENVNMRLDENAARALYDALAQHFAGEAGGRQTRADLMHERGRVDKLTDALIVAATGSAALTGIARRTP